MATDQPVLHFPVNDNPQLMLFITFLRLSAGKKWGGAKPSPYFQSFLDNYAYSFTQRTGFAEALPDDKF